MLRFVHLHPKPLQAQLKRFQEVVNTVQHAVAADITGLERHVKNARRLTRMLSASNLQEMHKVFLLVELAFG